MLTLQKITPVIACSLLLLFLSPTSFSSEVGELRSEINQLRREVDQLRKRVSTIRIATQSEKKKLLARQRTLERDVDKLTLSLKEKQKNIAELINYLGNIKSIAPQLASLTTERSKKATQTSQNNDLNKINPNQYYQRGFDFLVKGAYSHADLTFSNFIMTFPGHAKTPNATYWSGEARYLQKKFDQALLRYEDFIANYPDGNKYSDSLLKAGYTLMELKRYGEASKKFQLIVKKFPQKTVAKLARKRLEILDDISP